ncbi:MAG TPA: SIMPL domain-containing protein [Anseongella sp.]|nr:SIMPL domain-containing protein [Anseongella sp.]
MKTLLFAAVLTTIAAGVRAQQSSPGPALVTVTGQHIIKAAPDEAEVNFMVSTKLKDPKEAQKANDAVMAKALAYLKKQYIAEKDIRTTRLSLHPYTEYVSDKERKELYMAQQSVSFRLENLDQLSGILSGLVDLGVNNIENVQFKVSNMEELSAQARAKAVLDARAKAENLAGALGQKVGKAYQINDMPNNGPQPMMYRMEAKAADSAESIAPGEISIEAGVMVSFLLN